MAAEPVRMEVGQAAEFSGVLISDEDAAKLAAELVGLRATHQRLATQLAECEDVSLESLQELDRLCGDQLSQTGQAPEIVLVPWWTWPLLATALVLGFAGGFWVGGL